MSKRWIVDALLKYAESTRMLHKSLVRGLARPLNAGLFEPIGACASSSHG